jgi:hypothetical protein
VPAAAMPAGAPKCRSRAARHQRSAKRRGRHQYVKAFHRILPFSTPSFAATPEPFERKSISFTRFA